MPLLPDPAHLLAVADRIAAHAAATRERALALSRAAEGGTWHGPAAIGFDRAAADVAAGLARAAARLDDAADALRRHAGRVSAAGHGVLDDLVAGGGLALATAGGAGHAVSAAVDGVAGLMGLG